MAQFTAHSMEIDGTILGALTSVSLPTNTETSSDDGGGLYDVAHSVVSQLPVFSFTTKSVQAALKKIGLNGLCFSAAIGNSPVDIFGQVVSDCQNSPASTANVRYRVPMGLIVPTTLTIPRSGDATLAFDVHCLSEGGNAPFSFAYSSITLPTAPVSEKYGMGASKVHSVVWPEPTNFELAFGLEIADKLPGLGSTWAEVTGVRKSRPVITISGRDPTILDDTTPKIQSTGSDPAHANTLFQLVKRVAGGSFVAAATAQHMNFTAAGIAIIDNPFSTSGDAIAEVSAQVKCVYDGTNAPIVFGFDAAYDSTP